MNITFFLVFPRFEDINLRSVETTVHIKCGSMNFETLSVTVIRFDVCKV